MPSTRKTNNLFRKSYWLGRKRHCLLSGFGDILIAVVDGLKGFPETISAAFPQTQIQPALRNDPQQPGLHGMEGFARRSRRNSR
jgi:putative transposase